MRVRNCSSWYYLHTFVQKGTEGSEGNEGKWGEGNDGGVFSYPPPLGGTTI